MADFPLGSIPGFIDANLGLKTDPEVPPPIWVDLLTGHAPKIRRIMVTGKRGSAKYLPLPGGQWEIAALEKTPGPEDSDERHHDAKAWAIGWAKRAWAFCLEWSATNGRPCDVQIVALTFDEKKGIYVAIDAKAKNIPDDEGSGGLVTDLAGQGEARILAWVIVQQQSALTAAHARGDKVYSELEAILKAVRQSFETNSAMFDRVIKERETFASAAADERKEHRAFLLETIRATQRHESIGHAIDRFGPLLEELAETFLFGEQTGGTGERAWQKKARHLIASITPEQIEAARAAGVFDLVEDLLSVLRALEAETVREQAQSLVLTMATKIKPHSAKLREIMTDDQRLVIFGLFKFAGLAV